MAHVTLLRVGFLLYKPELTHSQFRVLQYSKSNKTRSENRSEH